MINLYNIADEKLTVSMRALRDELRARGWQAQKITEEGQNLLFLTRPDGRIIRTASSTPETTSAFSNHLATDKWSSYCFLRDFSIPQPETILVESGTDTIPLIERHGKIVIKPVDGAHGKGVTTGVNNPAAAEQAIDRARANTSLPFALAQAEVSSTEPELRVVCIGYKFIAALARIPAAVTGDGEHTALELIDIENKTLRTPPYTSNLTYIDREAAITYLGESADQIPAAGTKMQVLGTCNTGQGGTLEDYTEQFSPERRSLSEKIARITGLPVIGIDFFGDKVIEINSCPGLYDTFDDENLAMRCIRAYVDYLEKL